MNLQELRPHLSLRLSHELGNDFLTLSSTIVSARLLELKESTDNFYNDYLGDQNHNNSTHDYIMDALYRSGLEGKLEASIYDTKPKGFKYCQLSTPSFQLLGINQTSKNSRSAGYFINCALSNLGLVEGSQAELLSNETIDFSKNLDHTLFVIVEVSWNKELEISEIQFIIPHPTHHHPLMKFSLNELRDNVFKPKTDISDEPMPVLKKHLNQFDKDEDISI